MTYATCSSTVWTDNGLSADGPRFTARKARSLPPIRNCAAKVVVPPSPSWLTVVASLLLTRISTSSPSTKLPRPTRISRFFSVPAAPARPCDVIPYGKHGYGWNSIVADHFRQDLILHDSLHKVALPAGASYLHQAGANPKSNVQNLTGATSPQYNRSRLMVLRSVHEQHARVTLSSDSSLEEKAGGAAPLSFDMWLLL